jgi:hypothetical protein
VIRTYDEAVYRALNYRRYLQKFKRDLGSKAANLCGVATMRGDLSAILCKRTYPGDGGHLVDLGFLSARLITNTGVGFLVDDWDDSTTDITTMTYHDSGTSSTAEAATDTDLITPAGPTTRATGTADQPASNQLRNIGTIAYTGTLGIVEHGLFSQAARGGGSVLWDRSIFSVINVVSGDSIQFTYTLTVTAGT